MLKKLICYFTVVFIFELVGGCSWLSLNLIFWYGEEIKTCYISCFKQPVLTH